MDEELQEFKEEQEQEIPGPSAAPKKRKEKFNWDGDIDFSGKSKCVVCIGACGKGKSVAIKYMLLKNLVDRKFFQFGLVFTNTKFSDEYNYLPDKYIVQGYDEDILRKYIEKLRKYKKQHKSLPPNFIIFEDLIGLLRKADPFLISFFGSHRHTNTHIIFSFQHLNTGASTLLREIATHALCWNSKQMNTMESIWLNFGQLFDNFEHFKRNFLDITKEKYSAMLYLQENDELNDNYFVFKAPDMTKFKKIQVEY